LKTHMSNSLGFSPTPGKINAASPNNPAYLLGGVFYSHAS